MNDLRLLTFNALMKGGVRSRLRALGAALDGADHDVVCLQEVMYRANVRLFARAYPHRFLSGGVMLKGGLVMLSRWPITRCRFVRYPMTGLIRPEFIMRKGAQVAVIATPGGEVAVVNTHLSANRDDDWSADNRYTIIERAELGHLAAAIATIAPSLPVVAVGDFNVPRTSPVLQSFIATAGLRDVLAGDTRPTYRPTPTFPTPPAFDHVLVRSLTGSASPVFQDEVPLDGGRTGYLSDHYGIAASLSGPATLSGPAA